MHCKNLYTKEASVSDYKDKPVVFEKQTILICSQLPTNGSPLFKYQVTSETGEMGDEGVFKLDKVQNTG